MYIQRLRGCCERGGWWWFLSRTSVLPLRRCSAGRSAGTSSDLRFIFLSFISLPRKRCQDGKSAGTSSDASLFFLSRPLRSWCKTWCALNIINGLIIIRILEYWITIRKIHNNLKNLANDNNHIDFFTQLVQDLVRAEPGFTTPELLWEVNQLSVSLSVYLSSTRVDIYRYLSMGYVSVYGICVSVYLRVYMYPERCTSSRRVRLSICLYISIYIYPSIHIHVHTLLSCSYLHHSVLQLHTHTHTHTHTKAVGQMVPSFREKVGGDPFIAVVAYKGSPPPGWMMQVCVCVCVCLSLFIAVVTCKGSPPPGWMMQVCWVGGVGGWVGRSVTTFV